ncbi:hypothetical protein DLAC_06070 [Tieghemostelium lacteum]|uniref:DUF218 domain-containing protein n=1 Tax=Tieghemostelium lacteum TaxID=361077 RepID=A0A151ZHK0_TIELA|nr:hypothetical protein DLAC_06070 [Tieghemostelium lacteum]|eukprot:KYQ93389.1 hypothetical protein DLAC_06070 [Tieghemostelium lacteum]
MIRYLRKKNKIIQIVIIFLVVYFLYTLSYHSTNSNKIQQQQQQQNQQQQKQLKDDPYIRNRNTQKPFKIINVESTKKYSKPETPTLSLTSAAASNRDLSLEDEQSVESSTSEVSIEILENHDFFNKETHSKTPSETPTETPSSTPKSTPTPTPSTLKPKIMDDDHKHTKEDVHLDDSTMGTFNSGDMNSQDVVSMFNDKLSTDPMDLDTSQANDGEKLDLYDVGITVLGYKLYEDGMPTKILRDRVNLAAEHYKDLKLQGYFPILLLSGKGKEWLEHDDEQAFASEADAMFSLLVAHNIPPKDIHLDPEATNTAENARNTLQLFLKNDIKRLLVITSDYHVLRSQYIFQTVFPSNIEVEFYGAPTSAQIRKHVAGEEKVLFGYSQRDLSRIGMLDTNESFGYHPIRNLPRWRMIEREIEYDLNHFRTIENGSFLVDYGSNSGYFSLHLAEKLPGATMFSLEGEAINEYRTAATEHETKMKEMNITNNFLCKTKVVSERFKELLEKKHVYEYQLCLSVFHWFGMKTKEEFEEVLHNHLMNAKTTFIELPEPMRYIGKEGQHAWKHVNDWYSGRNEVEIFADLKDKYQMKMTWKILGALIHDNKTVRKVIRVDVRGQDNDKPDEDPRKPLSQKDLEELYHCGKLMHK